MRIRFQRRISGLARVAWKWEEFTVDSYEVARPGEQIKDIVTGETRQTWCHSIRIPGRGRFELRAGTLKVLEK